MTLDSISQTLVDLELKLSDPETFLHFKNQEADLSEPHYAVLHHRKWLKESVPLLMKMSQKSKIVGDAFPHPIHPDLHLQLNFSNTNWLGAHGHDIPPNWALYSPSLIIHTHEKKTRHFTLLMTDLDAPNVKEKKYQEWCHWLV
jgi:large subunit ribosomal protein L35